MSGEFQTIVLTAPTAQQVYDAACEYLWNQQEQCSSNDYCLYRSPDRTNACAVGAFLPADHELVVNAGKYKEDGLDDLIHRDDMPSWFYDHEDLLCDFQALHDQVPANHELTTISGLTRYEDLTKGFERIAKEYGLKPWCAPEKENHEEN